MTHVLVTRPNDASQQLADMLGVHDLEPMVMPMYTFTARKPGLDTDWAWSDKQSRRLAVFTSPRAVQFGIPYFPESKDSSSGTRRLTVTKEDRVCLKLCHQPASSGKTGSGCA